MGELGRARQAQGGPWEPDCAQAFKEAVARARRKFDIAWPFLGPVAFPPLEREADAGSNGDDS